MENNPQPSLPPERRHQHFHIFWPLLLIAVGIFLFLNSTHSLPGTATDTLLKLWPLLLVIAGLDSFLNRGGFVGSVLFIGLGGIFLLSNFGYIQVSVWNVILRLWPVLFIAWGLDLLIGRRRTVFSWLAGIIVGLALVGGIFWFATTYSTTQAPRMETITQPLVGAKSADGSISMTAGTLKLAGGAATSNILEAKLGLRNNQNFSQSSSVQNGINNFSLRDESNNNVYPFDITDYVWEIMLNNKVPLTLDVSQATGIMTVDFSGMDIASFNLKIAAGQIELTLPASGSYDGVVEGAASTIKIHLPQNSKLCLQTSTAVSVLSLPTGFNRTTDCGKAGVPNLELKNAVGAVTIEYTK